MVVPRKADRKKLTKKEQIEKRDSWKKISNVDLELAEIYFTHFNTRVINSSVSDVSIRLADGYRQNNLPYISLSTLGVSLTDLDYFKGSGKEVPKPRQIKDLITGESTGIDRDFNKIPVEDIYALRPDGKLAEKLKMPFTHLPELVPVLLRQIILKDNIYGDISVTPIGSMALTRKIKLALDEAGQTHIQKKMYRAENMVCGKNFQNAGLIAAVSGKGVAHFAWHFKPPGFSNSVLSNLYRSVFKPMNFSLSNNSLMMLCSTLSKWLENDFLRTRVAVDNLIKKLAQEVLDRASSSSSLLLDQLIKDYSYSNIVSHPDAMEILFKNSIIPNANKKLWCAVFEKDDIEKGWIYEKFRSHHWSKMAAEQIINLWIIQSKKPLGSSKHKKLVETLRMEIFK